MKSLSKASLEVNHTYTCTLTYRQNFGIEVKSSARLSPPKNCGKNSSIRGCVVGFSSASAARLRHLLFTLDYSGAVGFALTAPPWSTVTPEQAFDALSRNKSRSGVSSLVWRKEVTKRGISHYHCIAFPKGDALSVVEWFETNWARALLPSLDLAKLKESDSRLVDRLAGLDPKEALERARWEVGRNVSHPSNIVTGFASSTNAVRYLLDHTSKHKAYQSLTTGRAWGVWSRSNLPEVRLPNGIRLDELPANVQARVFRHLQKISRYWWLPAGAPRDSIWLRRYSRGRRFDKMGRKTLFKDCIGDIARLVTYAMRPPVPEMPLESRLRAFKAMKRGEY